MDIQAVTHASDAELVGLLAGGDEDTELKCAAWETLVVRHIEYLWSIVVRVVRDESVAEDVVTKTFESVRRWANRQEDPDTVATGFTDEDPDRIVANVRRWLAVIADRKLKDHYRKTRADAEAFDRYVTTEMHRSPSKDDEPVSTTKLRQLRAALDSLSGEEADALRYSLPWYDADKKCFNVPRGEAAQLAASLGINVDALRQRRSRALQHLAKHMQQHSPDPAASNPP